MRVLVIDDDKLVCTSLKTILQSTSDIEVVGLGYNGEMAIALYKELLPDILLMDIRMDIMTGLEAGEHILETYPHAKILYLTTFLDDEYIIKALNLGAKGYLLKQDFESIIPSLRAVYSGQNVYGTEIITKLPSLINETPKNELPHFSLTEKELELLTEIAEGLNNKEIATKLFLSEGTVRNYISNMLDKLALRDRTQLAIFYYKYMK